MARDHGTAGRRGVARARARARDLFNLGFFAATQDLPGGPFVGPDGFAHMRGYPEIATPSRTARDAALARRLWDLSADLTGVGASA